MHVLLSFIVDGRIYVLLIIVVTGVKAGVLIILNTIRIFGGWDWLGGSALEYLYV